MTTATGETNYDADETARIFRRLLEGHFSRPFSDRWRAELSDRNRKRHKADKSGRAWWALAREEWELTQGELAVALGVGTYSISRWEGATRNPDERGPYGSFLEWCDRYRIEWLREFLDLYEAWDTEGRREPLGDFIIASWDAWLEANPNHEPFIDDPPPLELEKLRGLPVYVRECLALTY